MIDIIQGKQEKSEPQNIAAPDTKLGGFTAENADDIRNSLKQMTDAKATPLSSVLPALEIDSSSFYEGSPPKLKVNDKPAPLGPIDNAMQQHRK